MAWNKLDGNDAVTVIKEFSEEFLFGYFSGSLQILAAPVYRLRIENYFNKKIRYLNND